MCRAGRRAEAARRVARAASQVGRREVVAQEEAEERSPAAPPVAVVPAAEADAFPTWGA
ncbi:Uncharacterised protein [Mycobacteroides abscessus subsp. abscessus]|nr:Uncharacterised protein [Mycobacteroides abscessus subsp. abscessus]